MDPPDRERWTDHECEALFDRLFPQGFSGRDVLAEIAPEGWVASPLLCVFHPSVERVFEETLAIHRNIASLRRRDDSGRPREPEPTIEEVRNGYQRSPIEEEREVRELVGMCLWDVFSDNHEVISADERLVDLGSWRASAGFVSDLANRQARSSRYCYMDFYMGTAMVGGRADLTPVYRMIFRRLKGQELDWEYHFPRLYLLDLRPLRDQLRDESRDEPEWASYSPSRAVEEETAREEHDRGIEELRDTLDEAHREALAESKRCPPPATVAAYRSVYGRFPVGWPPSL
jgi:hypothetical protein